MDIVDVCLSRTSPGTSTHAALTRINGAALAAGALDEELAR
jgi:hypothetical protein